MATIRNFEVIETWNLAMILNRGIYEATQKETFAKYFSLRDQINKASGSIMDNIAEGIERASREAFILFLGYAKGSAGEVRSQLYRAFDRKNTIQTGATFITYLSLSYSKIKSSRYKKSESSEHQP